jgi:hypothetical protein
MNCEQARFALAANPADADARLAAHLQDCEACAVYAAQMRALDRRLLEAMRVPTPTIALPQGPYVATRDDPPTATVAAPRVVERRWALAASVIAVAMLVSVLWTGYPRTSLAGAVVAHMAHEPDAWDRRAVLPRKAVDAFLERQGVRLDGTFPDVTYRQSCWFRGRFVPHLVVRTEHGPFTVLLLPHIEVETRNAFDEEGFRGVLVPTDGGSFAVIARDAIDVDEAATRVRAAVRYVR